MKYKCAYCKEDCESDESKWTEEDAIKERDALWGDNSPFDIVCDSCFKKFMSWYERQKEQPNPHETP